MIENARITFRFRVHEDDIENAEKSIKEWFRQNEIAMFFESLESDILKTEWDEDIREDSRP